jgi:hypothetical protein
MEIRLQEGPAQEEFLSEPSRSRAYPAIDLQEALEMLQKVTYGLGWGEHDRDAIAQALGYSSGSSGAAIRKIAALAHYGALQRKQGSYSPTLLARTLLDPKSKAELQVALQKAFLNPALFREIVEAYLPDGKVPRLLAHTLRIHRIASNAAEEVARVFMASAQFAGILAADGVFEASYLESTGNRPAVKPQSLSLEESATEPSPAEKREEQEQELKISLTDGKFGYIRLPRRLNDQDIRILKKQIEVLETQVDANKAAPPLRFARRQDREPS